MINYQSIQNKNMKDAMPSHQVPFKWAGGKRRMFKKYQLRGFFPNEEPKVFVDMFAGSACVSYWIAKNYPSTRIVLNEACEELVNLYRQISGKHYHFFEPEYLKHVKAYGQYSTVPDRKKYYYQVRNDYALSYKNKSDLELAASLLFLLQTGFNGIWQTSSNFNWRYASPAGVMTWKPNGKLFDLTKIKNYSEFITNCTVVSGDFRQLSTFSSDKTWYYADPPYRNSFAKYNSAGEFVEKDHFDLNNFLIDRHNEGAVCALSNREDTINNFVPDSNKISQGWFSDKFDDDWNCSYFTNIRYTAGRSNKNIGSRGTEVLIKNY